MNNALAPGTSKSIRMKFRKVVYATWFIRQRGRKSEEVDQMDLRGLKDAFNNEYVSLRSYTHIAVLTFTPRRRS